MPRWQLATRLALRTGCGPAVTLSPPPERATVVVVRTLKMKHTMTRLQLLVFAHFEANPKGRAQGLPVRVDS